MDLNDYDSDEELYPRAQFTHDILEEMKNDCIIKKIHLFKNILCKEPEFYGVDKICSEKIHEIINSAHISYEHIIDEYQTGLFNDLYTGIYGISGNILLYNNVAKKILNIVLV